MSTKMTLPMAEMPPVIAESVRAVLEAKGLHICRLHALSATAVEGQELADVLREVGNNTTQALFDLDENPEGK